MTRKALFAFYILTIAAMAAATIIEKSEGTDFVSTHIYGAWWFTLLWAMLAATGIAWIARRRLRRWSLLTLHASLAIILAGALLTHLTARRGMIHLRIGQPTATYYEDDGTDTPATRSLPFEIRLDRFDIEYYKGTKAPSDYVSALTIIDGTAQAKGRVSMNNIMTYSSVRLYQSSYDEDMRGSILAVNSDPWGIAVTYTGYALLFISLVWMLIDPGATYRKLLRSPLLRRGIMGAAALLAMAPQAARAATTLPEADADRLGRLNILYNDRICQLQTLAIDFTKKLHGSRSYRGLTAEQVLTGWIFWGDEWSDEPFIKLKDGELKETLQLPDYVSVNTFFNSDMGGYILGPYIHEYYRGNRDAFHKQAADIDNKIQLIMELRRGLTLKVFPHTAGGHTTWYAPTDNLPDTIGNDRRLYMANVFSLLYGEILKGNMPAARTIIDKMAAYQTQNAGHSLPGPVQTWAERTYNAIPFATILFMVGLAMGLVTLAAAIIRLSAPRPDTMADGRACKAVRRISLATMGAAFAALTFCGALRWIVSGNIPMSNGYETMLLVAWLVMLLSMAASRRFPIALTFGFLMAGFFLLVSHIGQMDPAITNIMPVLNSPLLSIHVSVIMLAFALLSLTFICGVTALAIAAAHRLRGSAGSTEAPLASLQLLSRLLLYPALAALGIGTFVGAVWANVSWGQYWGWDPKETWALITLMVYAVAAHTDTLPALKRPLCFHAFMAAAFLTILMTYFGVNYFLGSGMHTYA